MGESNGAASPQGKKVYSTPVLAAYGTVASLTLGGASAGGDRASRLVV
jgi:hypothetical protein